MKARVFSWIHLGQHYMTKLIFLIIFFLSSCAGIQYQNLPKMVNELVFGAEDFVIDQSFYDNFEFSFAKIRIGRSGTAIFVLSGINSNNEYEWVSSTKEKLITKNGKVIKLFSEKEYTFSYLNPSIFNNFPNEEFSEYLIELEYPAAVFKQSSIIKKQSIDQPFKFLGKELSNVTHLIETVRTERFKWEFTNEYWFNESQQIIKSSQYLHPNLQKITIEFYYKY